MTEISAFPVCEPEVPPRRMAASASISSLSLAGTSVEGDEIKDLMDQLGEGGRSIHELDKQRRRLQVYYTRIMFGLSRSVEILEDSNLEYNIIIRIG